MKPGTIVKRNWERLNPLQRRVFKDEKEARFIVQGPPSSKAWSNHVVIIREDNPRAKLLCPRNGGVWLPEDLITVGHIDTEEQS
jgi:hypothetical protein